MTPGSVVGVLRFLSSLVRSDLPLTTFPLLF
jgi:hypothetical protein